MLHIPPTAPITSQFIGGVIVGFIIGLATAVSRWLPLSLSKKEKI